MVKISCLYHQLKYFLIKQLHYSLTHFYIVKLGFAGVYLFFLFLLQNIDCVLSKNKKNIKIFQRKIFIFYNFKNIFILHGHVFVMHGNKEVLLLILSDTLFFYFCTKGHHN